MKQLVCALVLLFSPLAMASADFIPGEHYQVLQTRYSSSPEVVEYFSYFCPFCYNFESVVTNLETALPEGISVTKVPVPFIGGAMGPVLQRAHALAEILQVDEQISTVLFNQIHQVRQPPENIKAVRQLFAATGVDNDQFDANFNSMAVNMRINNYDNAIKDTDIHSVPSFVINNKYLINLKAVSSQEQFNALINHLLTLTAGAEAQ